MSLRFRHATLAVSCAVLLVCVRLAPGQDAPATRRVTTPGVAGAQVQINQIETSQFPKVIIFATGLKDNAPVLGLSAADFRVREDEVDQEPLTVAPQLTPLSVVLTLDTSGSMKKRLADAQAAAKSFLGTLHAQDKVQVIRKEIYLAEGGGNRLHVRLFAVQRAASYGEDMPVPPGTYDLYIDVAGENRLQLVAEKREVRAGKVTEVK